MWTPIRMKAASISRYGLKQQMWKGLMMAALVNQSINQSIYLANCATTTKNEYQQNNVKHSDGLPEKQIAHLSWSPK